MTTTRPTVPRWMRVPAIVFGFLFLFFFMTAFFFQKELTQSQEKIINGLYPIMAGLFTMFFTGSISVKIGVPSGRLGQILLSAGGGAAVFWLTFTAPLFVEKTDIIAPLQRAQEGWAELTTIGNKYSEDPNNLGLYSAASRIARDLDSIPPGTLDTESRIRNYMMICYANLVRADLSSDPILRGNHSADVLKFSQRIKSEMNDLRSRGATARDAADVLRQLDSERIEDLCDLYVLSIEVLNSADGGLADKRQSFIDRYNRLDEQTKTGNPLETDPILGVLAQN